MNYTKLRREKVFEVSFSKNRLENRAQKRQNIYFCLESVNLQLNQSRAVYIEKFV